MGAVTSLYSPLVNSLYPNMVVTGDYGFAKKVALVALPFTLAGAVMFALLSRCIVLVLGGPQYLAGTSILTLMSPIVFFGFYSMLLGWPVLGAMGSVRALTATTVGSAAFSAATLIVFGVAGIASMTLVCVVRVLSEAVLCVSRFVICAKLQKTKLKEGC